MPLVTLKELFKFSPNGCDVVEYEAGEHDLAGRALEVAVSLGIVDGADSTAAAAQAEADAKAAADAAQAEADAKAAADAAVAGAKPAAAKAGKAASKK